MPAGCCCRLLLPAAAAGCGLLLRLCLLLSLLLQEVRLLLRPWIAPMVVLLLSSMTSLC
jgi:hypothetical protein